MVGAGAHVFAVMGYVISHQQPDKEHGGVVRLNPLLLAAILGEPLERVEAAMEVLTSPDPKTTTPGDDGRRLVRIGQFDYRVVNYVKYFGIRNEEDKRRADRERQQKHREKKKAEMSQAQQEKDKKRRATLLDKAVKKNFIEEDGKGPKEKEKEKENQ